MRLKRWIWTLLVAVMLPGSLHAAADFWDTAPLNDSASSPIDCYIIQGESQAHTLHVTTDVDYVWLVISNVDPNGTTQTSLLYNVTIDQVSGGSQGAVQVEVDPFAQLGPTLPEVVFPNETVSISVLATSTLVLPVRISALDAVGEFAYTITLNSSSGASNGIISQVGANRVNVTFDQGPPTNPRGVSPAAAVAGYKITRTDVASNAAVVVVPFLPRGSGCPCADLTAGSLPAGTCQNYIDEITPPADSSPRSYRYRIEYVLDSGATQVLADVYAIVFFSGTTPNYPICPAGSPGLEVSGRGVPISGSAVATTTTDGTDFGQILTGSTYSSQRTFVIRNTGTAAFSITEPIFISGSESADFSLLSSPTGSVAAGQTTSVVVRFVPGAAGLRNATIQIPTDVPSVFTFTFPIGGEGLEALPGYVMQQQDLPTTSTGWLALGPDDASLGSLGLGARGVDVDNHALTVDVAQSTRTRVFGWSENANRDLPYASIGTGSYLRAKFAVYTTGAGQWNNPATSNQIPNFRLRLMQRFVVNSMLEVFHNAGQYDPAVKAAAAEFGPSSSSAQPSVYRVDLDPIDIPYLQGAAGATEGYQRGFEAVADVNPLLPDFQYVNGRLSLSESTIGTYPKLDPTVGPLKSYVPGGTAGNSDFDNKDIVIAQLRVDHDPLAFGVIQNLSFGAASGFTVTTGTTGVTFSTTGLTSAVAGLASVDFNGGNFADSANPAGRARLEEGRIYRVSFRVASLGQAAQHCQIRLRTRAVKFQWSHKLELGGAAAVGSVAGRTIAQQMLPGVGSQNPDQDAGGVWYHVLFPSPLQPEIRSDVAGSIQQKFPLLSAQPGPGDPSRSSFRDIRVGIDVIDTLSFGTGYDQEVANGTTLNRIEIRDYAITSD